GVHPGDSVLDPMNVEAALGEFDLLPLQVAHLGGPQTVAIGDKDHGRVAMPVAAVLASAAHQSLDLALGEIAPSNCQIYDVWCAFPGPRSHRGKTPLLDVAHFLHSRKGRSDCMERIRVRGMRGQHEPRGQPHFVLPPNLYMGPPVGGTFWFQIFIQAPSPEIW